MGNLAHIHDGFQVTVLGIHHGDLVRVVGGCHEVTHAGVPAAIVEEAGGIDVGDGEVIQVLIVHQHDLAGFLHVHDELGMLVGGHNGCYPWLRVVFLGAHGHAPGADNLLRLQGLAVHDHELGRPVGTGDGQLVFPALVLGGFHRTGLHADLDLGDGVGLFHPQVDHVDQRIPADHEHIAT